MEKLSPRGYFRMIHPPHPIDETILKTARVNQRGGWLRAVLNGDFSFQRLPHGVGGEPAEGTEQ